MITNAGLGLMGFQPLSDGEVITAAFHLLRVYGIQGIVVDDAPAKDCPVYSGPGYQLAIGNSVNEMSKAMVGDAFVDDEDQWRKTVRLSPPFLLLHVGPTEATTVDSGFVQRRDGVLLTHDCFPEAKRDLARRETEALEPALTALSVAFSDLSHPVELHACGREVFGLTDRGETLHDLKFSMSATAYVSSRVPTPEVANRVQHAVRLQAHLDPDVGRFYYMGLTEEDPLKRFLYFFLFIERYTHQVYQRLIGQAGRDGLFNVPARLASSVTEFWDEMKRDAKTLTPRFMWCAILAWADLTDEDVSNFKHLKAERDRVSHGERTTVEMSLAARARHLSARILLSEVPRTTEGPQGTA